jgi:hypothetical protein
VVTIGLPACLLVLPSSPRISNYQNRRRMSALHFLATFPSNSLNTALSPAVETLAKITVVDENNILMKPHFLF